MMGAIERRARKANWARRFAGCKNSSAAWATRQSLWYERREDLSLWPNAVAATDQQIDAPVCQLYRLLPEEIALVEGNA